MPQADARKQGDSPDDTPKTVRTKHKRPAIPAFANTRFGEFVQFETQLHPASVEPRSEAGPAPQARGLHSAIRVCECKIPWP
mmetsp:Transcript_463/g.1366  ORF Transcript_463/g.1366 Transcript_463/m.1366 type:complete len:82 (-) Transcript_463:307-552(-)